MEYQSVRVSDIIRAIDNQKIYLPAIQREFVWSTYQIERLFDSIMTDFPIGSFLYWNLEEENKNEWPIYEFIRDFNQEHPHNQAANMAGIRNDITLVLDGQQRIASLFIGLRGSYRYFYYRWRQTRLYLNLLKQPMPDDGNPEDPTYGFAFRESDAPSDDEPQLWYLVGNILDFEDAEDAKEKLEKQLGDFLPEQQKTANKMVGRLHQRIHTARIGNYYEEKSQDYDKVLQIFVRANSAGEPLGYSDLLLSTATAQWKTLNAREQIHAFTDSLNAIQPGYRFGKDFVLKACLYLTRALPVQYKVKNFTKTNLHRIEENWENIKWCLSATVRLLARFGFTAKNIVAPLALLPIALYIMQRGNKSFHLSSEKEDGIAQATIRKWFVFSTIKGAFGRSSDTTLSRLRGLLHACPAKADFPDADLYKSLEIEPRFNEDEITQILGYKHGQKYTYLVLSLLYPDNDLGQYSLEEDHIFPKSQFNRALLRKSKYDDAKVESYMKKYDTIANLQLLPTSENRSKSSKSFEKWLDTRDDDFKNRHLIPKLKNYGLDAFETFCNERTALITKKLESQA